MRPRPRPNRWRAKRHRGDGWGTRGNGKEPGLRGRIFAAGGKRASGLPPARDSPLRIMSPTPPPAAGPPPKPRTHSARPLPATRRTLLARLRGGAGDPAAGAAWRTFAADYEAGLLHFARAKGLQDSDARDAVQETLLAVHAALTNPDEADRPTFAAAGAFRGWLTRVAFYKCVDAVRRRTAAAKLGGPAGGTAALGRLAELPGGQSLEEPDDWRRWAFCVAAGRVEPTVDPATWAAFTATAVAGKPAAQVAADLGLSLGAVYAAKSRTLAKLRAVAATINEDDAPEGPR